MKMFSLKGNAALVTGSSKGIGRAIATAFATEGADLAVTGRNEEELNKLADELGPARDRVHTFAVDLTDSAAGERIVGEALVKAGSIDTLIVNAGTLADGLFAGLTDYELSQVYEVNLWGALRTLRAALRPMILHRGGSIVIVSSTAAQRPGVGQAAYASSKAALESIVRVTARETAARGIRVNAVAPGLLTGGMATRILDEEFDRARAVIPMRRAGEAEEVVPAVLFLASPMSSYITGQVWSIDGGFTA